MTSLWNQVKRDILPLVSLTSTSLRKEFNIVLDDSLLAGTLRKDQGLIIGTDAERIKLEEEISHLKKSIKSLEAYNSQLEAAKLIQWEKIQDLERERTETQAKHQRAVEDIKKLSKQYYDLHAKFDSCQEGWEEAEIWKESQSSKQDKIQEMIEQPDHCSRR